MGSAVLPTYQRKGNRRTHVIHSQVVHHSVRCKTKRLRPWARTTVRQFFGYSCGYRKNSSCNQTCAPFFDEACDNFISWLRQTNVLLIRVSHGGKSLIFMVPLSPDSVYALGYKGCRSSCCLQVEAVYTGAN